MSAKIIALIVAALGLGFAGTYFATSGDCSGGCPIAKFLHGDSSKSDCCPAATEPVSTTPECCSKAKTDCCAPGAACCEKSQPISVKKPGCCPNCEADEAKKTEEIKK